jgi:hypothetical protein
MVQSVRAVHLRNNNISGEGLSALLGMLQANSNIVSLSVDANAWDRGFSRTHHDLMGASIVEDAPRALADALDRNQVSDELPEFHPITTLFRQRILQWLV